MPGACSFDVGDAHYLDFVSQILDKAGMRFSNRQEVKQRPQVLPLQSSPNAEGYLVNTTLPTSYSIVEPPNP